jgi:hypothetical protein
MFLITIVGCRFGDTNQYGADDFRIKYGDLDIVAGSDENSHDYIVHRFPPGVDVTSRFNFELDCALAYGGQKVLILGYPFSSKFMTSHVGYISAIYESAGVEVYQLDASVNSGNSGGPLIDICTGKVLGIVTRKSTGLSEEFDNLRASFNDNINVLEESKGMLGLGNVDLVSMLQLAQKQMQIISENIKKSANVGIGYAFSCRSLESENL